MSDDVKKQWEEQRYQTDIGQKAQVSRETLTADEEIAECNKLLKGMGELLQQIDPAAKHMMYMGSAAVHIYMSPSVVSKDGAPVLNMMCQTSTLGDCPKLVAATAIQALQKDTAVRYGDKPGKKRSGF